jgi:hypothetical protein
MKKILLFTLLIGILTNSIFSQDFEKIYKGKDYKYYLGTELKVVGNTIKSILFENLSDVKYNGKNVIYPKNKSGYFSDETKLLGRVFKVEGIIGNDGKDYTGSYGNPSNLPIFKLRDIETLELIYFLYYYRNCTSGYGFPFETKKNFDDYYFCGDIKKEVDDFSDKITYDGDVISESGNYNSILKVVNGSDEVYYLSLRVDGSTVNVGEKGVILLLEDKTKINLPNEDVECKVSSDGSSYEYSSFIRLSDEHIRILKTKEIDKIRLYIYDYDFNKFSSLKFKEYLNCLLNS